MYDRMYIHTYMYVCMVHDPLITLVCMNPSINHYTEGELTPAFPPPPSLFLLSSSFRLLFKNSASHIDCFIAVLTTLLLPPAVNIGDELLNIPSLLTPRGAAKPRWFPSLPTSCPPSLLIPPWLLLPPRLFRFAYSSNRGLRDVLPILFCLIQSGSALSN